MAAYTHVKTNAPRTSARSERIRIVLLGSSDVAGTCRRDTSTGVARSHGRPASIQLCANTKAEGRKKGSERVALPRAQRDTYAASARHRLPADVPDGRCGTRSGGSRRDFSDAQSRPGVLSMPFTLVCIIFTYLYFIVEYNAALSSLPFYVLLFFQLHSSFSVWFFNARLLALTVLIRVRGYFRQ